MQSADGLGPSPAVAAIGRGASACSGKSEEGPRLFEPSPVAVTSARENWGEAKTVVVPEQVVSSCGGGDASSDGLPHSSPEYEMPPPPENSFVFARPPGMPAASPSLAMVPMMAPLPPSDAASSPPSSPPCYPLTGVAGLPPLETLAELSAIKEGMDASDIERGLADGSRSPPSPDDSVPSDGMMSPLPPMDETNSKMCAV